MSSSVESSQCNCKLHCISEHIRFTCCPFIGYFGSHAVFSSRVFSHQKDQKIVKCAIIMNDVRSGVFVYSALTEVSLLS